jgi:hypothetical protein
MVTVEVEVDCCRECPYFNLDESECSAIQMYVEDKEGILDNCPFKD